MDKTSSSTEASWVYESGHQNIDRGHQPRDGKSHEVLEVRTVPFFSSPPTHTTAGILHQHLSNQAVPSSCQNGSLRCTQEASQQLIQGTGGLVSQASHAAPSTRLQRREQDPNQQAGLVLNIDHIVPAEGDHPAKVRLALQQQLRWRVRATLAQYQTSAWPSTRPSKCSERPDPD